MGDTTSPYTPPSSSSQTSNLRMFYCGLAIVGTAAIVFAVYNLIIIRWCSSNQQQSNQQVRNMPTHSFDNPNAKVGSSFKYRKEKVVQDQGHDYECSVCLSEFEDGEEVRQLPRCKHSFHAACIDMWLYSHLDCPLCRSLVEQPPVNDQRTRQSENSLGSLDPAILV